MVQGKKRAAPNKMDAAAKAEAKATTVEAPLDDIARAEEAGKINFDTDTDADQVQHNEALSDVGDPVAIARAYEEELIVPRETSEEDLTRARLQNESTDYVENGAAGDPGTQKKNSGGARKASVGQIVTYHSNARRAGLRNSAGRPAIVTAVDEQDGSVSLTVFDIDSELRVRKVTSNRQSDEHWRA